MLGVPSTWSPVSSQTVPSKSSRVADVVAELHALDVADDVARRGHRVAVDVVLRVGQVVGRLDVVAHAGRLDVQDAVGVEARQLGAADDRATV